MNGIAPLIPGTLQLLRTGYVAPLCHGAAPLLAGLIFKAPTLNPVAQAPPAKWLVGNLQPKHGSGPGVNGGWVPRQLVEGESSQSTWACLTRTLVDLAVESGSAGRRI